MKISDFETLTFDCYGTLIDWETGIADALETWAARRGVATSREELLEAFAGAEAQVESECPTTLYREVLRAVHHRLASRFDVPTEEDEAERFSQSVAQWPVFPDTPAALKRLATRYRLVVVSNVDHQSFSQTRPKLGVELDAVITAEDVGAYKPDHRMFEATFEVLSKMGVTRSQILHVAQSLFHDHVPAKQLGLPTVWVNRRKGREGWGATCPPGPSVVPNLEVASLSELVALDDAQRRGT